MTSDTTFWENTAENYAKSPIKDMPSYEYTLERTRSYLHATDRVLELGCGTASTAITLSDSVAEMVASDISAKMLNVGRERVAEANAANVTLVQAAPQNAPDGPFDVIMAHNLLHLLEDVDTALDAIGTRLKTGGLFISKTPCLGESMKSFKYRLIKLAVPLLQKIGKAPFVRFLGVLELEQAVTDAGFQIIESGNFPSDPPCRYLVARKL